jgi:dynein heavy chain
VLAEALSIMYSQNLNEKKVEYKVINPKSITMGQLYGQFDPVTHEWSDGVLATTFRNFTQQGTSERKWLVFDGPVDAIWIENMNTVLDDNKKLCLTSGEIMAMTSTMSIQFEVADLSVASPATVSRCGMIYLEPYLLGWRPLFSSWLKTLPNFIEAEGVELLTTLFEWVLPPSFTFLTSSCREIVPTSSSSMVYSLMNLISCQLNLFYTKGVVSDSEKPNLITSITKIFVFACIWSLGGTIDGKSRKNFSAFFKALIDGKSENTPKNVKVGFPEEGTIYDYFCEKDRNGCAVWKLWIDTIGNFSIPSKTKFNSITIPTVDTARYSYLLDLLIYNNKQVLFVGPTGTGKSVYINNKLINSLPKDQFTPIFINFSAQTSANQTQEILISKLDKRRKGVYGPQHGLKSVIFVDDLNMPAKEKYGAQPPIELLRQYMDHGQWYDLKDTSNMQLVDIQFVAAMGPPGGGRNQISGRFLRHLNVISITEFDDLTMKNIYNTILTWHFESNNFQGSVLSIANKVIDAVLDVYLGIIA